MSNIATKVIQCPSCGCDNEITVFKTLNATTDPNSESSFFRESCCVFAASNAAMTPSCVIPCFTTI